jgi:membrane associated rhomboid family serine protease
VSDAENTPIFNAPDAVKWIAGATLLAHIGRMYLLSDEGALSLLVDMAFIPARYSEANLAAHGLGWPLFLTPMTYLLVHGDFTHLLVNVFMFLAFGAAVGRRMGSWGLLQFYVLCGLVGAFAFWLFNIGLIAPVIGASGAVAGMVGAVCRMSFRPSDPSNSMPFSSRRSAFGFVVVWMLLNFFFGMLPPEALGMEGGSIAWETHLGGFIFGFIGISWFDGRGLPPNRFEFAPPTHS